MCFTIRARAVMCESGFHSDGSPRFATCSGRPGERAGLPEIFVSWREGAATPSAGRAPLGRTSGSHATGFARTRFAGMDYGTARTIRGVFPHPVRKRGGWLPPTTEPRIRWNGKGLPSSCSPGVVCARSRRGSPRSRPWSHCPCSLQRTHSAAGQLREGSGMRALRRRALVRIFRTCRTPGRNLSPARASSWP